MVEVSILTSLYNHESYIEQNILSIQESLLGDYEHIIVDDCSTDSSYDVAKKYADEDSRIILLRHDKNEGCPSALNTGLERATGKYVLTLSSDDSVSDYYIKSKILTLEKKDYDLIYTSYTYVDVQGEIQQYIFVEDFNRTRLEEKCYIPAITMLVKREILNQIGGWDEKLFSSEDWDLLLSISSIKGIKIGCDKTSVGYFYRVRDLSSSLENPTGHIGKCLENTLSGKLAEIHSYIREKHNLEGDCTCGCRHYLKQKGG